MKFLLLVAVAGLAALADSANIPGLPNLPGLPGLPNLFPKGKRAITEDLSSTVANLFQNNDFMNLFTDLLKQFGGEKSLFGLLPLGNTIVGLPGGLASDMAAGGKMAVEGIKADIGKRSILDETESHDIKKRELLMDLMNMLVGNFEGAMTGMDIVG